MGPIGSDLLQKGFKIVVNSIVYLMNTIQNWVELGQAGPQGQNLGLVFVGLVGHQAALIQN